MKTITNVTINKDYLREIIKKAGLTQKDFAESIGRDLDELQQERDGRP